MIVLDSEKGSGVCGYLSIAKCWAQMQMRHSPTDFLAVMV